MPRPAIELVWPGKYGPDGRRRAPALPAAPDRHQTEVDPVQPHMRHFFTLGGDLIRFEEMTTDDAAHRLCLGDLRVELQRITPGSIDFAYLDPPFGVGRTHRATRRARSADAEAAPADWFDPSDPISLIHLLDDAIQLIRPLLRPAGVIAIHTDHRAAAWVRALLDEHFGPHCFVNELVWKYGLGNATARRHFLRKHDTIAVYGRSPEYHFTPQRGDITPAQDRKYAHRDADGRRYMLSYGRKYYLKGGKPLESVLDVPALGATEHERCGYPTQKPIRLLEILVRAFCPAGGTVLDACCGSGTTGLATMAAGEGRRWIMIDRAPAAIETVCRRLAERPR